MHPRGPYPAARFSSAFTSSKGDEARPPPPCLWQAGSETSKALGRY